MVTPTGCSTARTPGLRPWEGPVTTQKGQEPLRSARPPPPLPGPLAARGARAPTAEGADAGVRHKLTASRLRPTVSSPDV